MKASEFYLTQIRSSDRWSHDEKFMRGKNVYTDWIENMLIRRIAGLVGAEASVLELGGYTGRVTRKLEKYFPHLTVSDVDASALPETSHSKLSIDLSLSLPAAQRFDCVVSFGQQVCFSGDAMRAIENISSLLKPGGISIFDVWNAEDQFFDDDQPKYEVDRCTIDQCRSQCDRAGLTVLSVHFGPRIYRLGGRYAGPILERCVRKGGLLSWIYVVTERIFSADLRFLRPHTQTIYLVVCKSSSMQ